MSASTLSVEAQRYQAHSFLTSLFELKPSTAAIVVAQEGRWHEATGFLSIHPVVERVATRPDFYVGACALLRKPGRGARGKESEAAFMPGAWIDVDIDGSPIRGRTETVTGHAPSRAVALDAIRAIGEPTLIVNSGYGLQPWFLLERGLVLHDAGEQRLARRIVHGLQRRLEREAGWKVDATADLARVMRVPGTVNTKAADPAPVELLPDGGPRYTLEQLQELAGGDLGLALAAAAEVPPAPSPGEWAERIRDGVGTDTEDTTRHERIWQLTGYLLRHDLDPAVAYELVAAFNQARVRPPYDERTVRKHFDGILRKDLEQRRDRAGGYFGRRP